MAIKLSYNDINNKMLEMALAKLARQVMPVKIAWNIQRIIRQMNKEVKEGRDIYMNLLKMSCDLDEKGELVPRRGLPIVKPDGTTEEGAIQPGTFTPKDEEDFKKRNEEFLAIEVTLDSFPILLKDIEPLHLSPEDLLALLPLIREESLKLVE